MRRLIWAVSSSQCCLHKPIIIACGSEIVKGDSLVTYKIGLVPLPPFGCYCSKAIYTSVAVPLRLFVLFSTKLSFYLFQTISVATREFIPWLWLFPGHKYLHVYFTEQSQTSFSHRSSFEHSQKTRCNWLSRAEVGDQSATKRQSVANHLLLRPCCDQSAFYRRQVVDWSLIDRRFVGDQLQIINDRLPFQRLLKGLSMHHPVITSDSHSS